MMGFLGAGSLLHVCRFGCIAWCTCISHLHWMIFCLSYFPFLFELYYFDLSNTLLLLLKLARVLSFRGILNLMSGLYNLFVRNTFCIIWYGWQEVLLNRLESLLYSCICCLLHIVMAQLHKRVTVGVLYIPFLGRLFQRFAELWIVWGKAKLKLQNKLCVKINKVQIS